MTKNWFVDWFASDFYQSVYNHRNSADAEKLIKLILSKTNLPKNSWVLDAACGFGRHSKLFSEHQMNVVGFDLSKTLLEKAKENLISEDNCFLIRGDFRNITFKKKFDLISNLFTSFGYFENDEENFAFVNHSKEFLKDSGYFVFDFFNKKFLEKNLIAESEREINGLVIRERREILNGRVEKVISIGNEEEKNKFYESVKLYTKSEIIENFKKAGYKHQLIYGDYNGNNFDEELSERLIIFFSI